MNPRCAYTLQTDRNFPVHVFLFMSPPGVKKGFIKGEALRLLRTNSSEKTFEENITGADPGGGCRGCATPPGMTCGRFLINTVQSLDRHTKSALWFDMYSQQFTLCYFLVKSPLLRIRV